MDWKLIGLGFLLFVAVFDVMFLGWMIHDVFLENRNQGEQFESKN